jgi:hypothetical protein
MTNKGWGQVAYEAFCTPPNDYLPAIGCVPWNNLAMDVQQRWACAALAVIDQSRKDDGEIPR